MDYADLFDEVELGVMHAVASRYESMFSSVHDKEDLVQEVAMAVLEAKQSNGDVHVFSVARNTVIDIARKMTIEHCDEIPEEVVGSGAEARVLLREIIESVENMFLNLNDGGALWDVFVKMGKDLHPSRSALREAGLSEWDLKQYKKTVKQGLNGYIEQSKSVSSGRHSAYAQ